MQSTFRSVVMALIVVAGFAFGQGNQTSEVDISPQGIVVNPKPSPTFDVTVRVNKDRSGSGTPIYFHDRRQGGDPISVTVTASERAYVYLFNVRTDGVVVQIYPNRLSGELSNSVSANVPVQFPPSNASWQFNVEPPYGVDRVVAVASKRRLDTSDLVRFANETLGQGADCASDCFAQSNLGHLEFARTLGIAVGQVPQADWVTDAVRFQIRRR